MKQLEYYFALGDLLVKLKLSQAEARRRYGFDRPGPGYISKNGFSILCNRPAVLTVRMLNVICCGMGLTPTDLWRTRKI